MVDVESDGPIPGDYSMISFGAVSVNDINKVCYGELKPISQRWSENALKVSGFTREDTMKFPAPIETMMKFERWIETNIEKPAVFISDNNGYDWQFINWYFWHFLGHNPFGHTSRNLNDLYKGLVKNMYKNCRHLRKTKHTHNPVDDAIGNVEALYVMRDKWGLVVPK